MSQLQVNNTGHGAYYVNSLFIYPGVSCYVHVGDSGSFGSLACRLLGANPSSKSFMDDYLVK